MRQCDYHPVAKLIMLQFHPSGIGQRVVATSLGNMMCYEPVGHPWRSPAPDAPPLIFLHNFGGGASAYEWSKVYPAFCDRYRVMAPDLLGWGQSDHPHRDYRVDDYLRTLTEFLAATCTQPAIVVAASLTGAIAVRLALQARDRIQALFLVAPSGFADFGQDAGRRLPLQLIGTPLVDQFVYGLGAMNAIAVRNFLENFLFAQRDRVSPAMVNAYLESAQQPNAQYAALAFLRGDLYFDLARYLPQLTVPTAIAWGTAAQFTPLPLGQRLAQLNPAAIKQFIPLEDTGILPHLELPAETIAALAQFLQTL